MDVLWQQLAEPFVRPADLGLRLLLQWGMFRFYEFLLVLARISGLMIVGPVFGQPVVPRNVRIMLIITLSLVILPTIDRQALIGFQKMDSNSDGRLVREEIPEQLEGRFNQQLQNTGQQENGSLSVSEFYPRPTLPSTLAGLVVMVVCELSLGFLLGLGILIVLSGVQLAGEMIDQQTGTSLGGVFNPGLEISVGTTGQFLYLAAGLIFLLLEPLGGHLLMISALVETFQTLPPGEAFLTLPTLELLNSLVHQSLVLTVQIAAPVLAAMSLVALTMGFLGYSVPQINVMMIGFPIRAIINTLILAITLSGMARALVDRLPATIQEIRTSLMFLP